MTDTQKPAVAARSNLTPEARRPRGSRAGTVLQSLVRGGVFFSWFLPSFSSIGYRLRSTLFDATALDFRDQRWLVTGASSGIGREIARRAALAGATVIAVARNETSLETLAAAVDAEGEGAGQAPPGRVVPVAADLSIVRSVDELLNSAALPPGTALDVLVNNVGVMRDQPAATVEGLDLALATNLVVPFQLTEELAARGWLDASSAVITMSSGGMYNVPLSLSALRPGRRYNGTLAYAFQKRAQVVLNRYWQERADCPFASYVMHPGWVDTPGVRSSMPDFHRLLKPILRDLEAGADTALWLAANRPTGSAPGGIWFDRARCSEHLLPGTRGGAAGDELVSFLRQQVEQAQG